MFAFSGSVAGQIVIADFMPGQDWIEVARGVNGLSLDGPQHPLSRLSVDEHGDAVLDLGGGATVTVSDVSVQRVGAHVQDWLHIV